MFHRRYTLMMCVFIILLIAALSACESVSDVTASPGVTASPDGAGVPSSSLDAACQRATAVNQQLEASGPKGSWDATKFRRILNRICLGDVPPDEAAAAAQVEGIISRMRVDLKSKSQ